MPNSQNSQQALKSREPRVIVATEHHDCEHLLGTFVDSSHYDELIDEDCDLYASTEVSLFGDDDDVTEEKCIFKFRKNFFSSEEQTAAWNGLVGAAGPTENRGMASGGKNDQSRNWVTDDNIKVMKWMMNPSYAITGDGRDAIRDIIQKNDKYASKGYVWLTNVVGSDFNFKEWAEKAIELPEDEMKEAAREKYEAVSGTSYANKVLSGIAGAFDRYPRIPYARLTSYTEKNYERFEESFQFLQKLAGGFYDLLPERYENQMNAARKVDERFVVPETPFTTITVNKTFRTACHRDAGDLSEGFSNLSVITNKKQAFTGGYLVLPEYRIAVNIRPGDLLLINNHAGIHGNTDIELEEGGERMSVVCYFREGLIGTGSFEYEMMRREFLEDRKNDDTHSQWRPGWNGVSPNCFSDHRNPNQDWEAARDWYNYLKKHNETFLDEYHPWLKEHFEGES